MRRGWHTHVSIVAVRRPDVRRRQLRVESSRSAANSGHRLRPANCGHWRFRIDRHFAATRLNEDGSVCKEATKGLGIAEAIESESK